MNIQQVAKRAKVSTATVSRTINNLPTVHRALAKRVWKAIEDLGYYPNTQARALVSGRSRIFGVVVSELTNPFFPEIVQVFETIAVQRGYEILVASTMNNPQQMKSSVRRMIERRVDGVAIMTFGMEDVLLEDLRLRKVPLVFVDVGPPRPLTSNIRINYANGIWEAVRHVMELGHRRVAFISGPLALKSAVARRDAFVGAMNESALEANEELIIEGNHTMEGGRLACGKLMERKERPTAILCSNDLTALGVMRKSFEMKIQIPRDLSVVGFDDVPMAQYVLPPLTTVQMSQAELARLAFQALLAETQRAEPNPQGTEFELKTTLVVRESTGAAKARATK